MIFYTHSSYKSEDGIIEFDRFEHDQEEIVKTAFGPMLARPGEKFGYSNVGYRLLGMLIEKVSGQSYWDFLAQRIFRPIGMEATRNSDPKTVILNRARGYGISGGKYENREPVTASAAFSEGALISSVLDMVKWDASGLCQVAKTKNGRFLKLLRNRLAELGVIKCYRKWASARLLFTFHASRITF